MDFLTRFSLKNPTVIMVTAALMLFGGLYTANELKRETMPDVSIPIIAVVAPYPGAAPTDVHDKVTQPIEQALSGVSGMDDMTSYSNDSVSVVVAEFGYSADMDEAEADINRLLQDVELPEQALDPTTSRISFGSFPVLKATVVGGDAEDLSALVQGDVVPALEALDGVGEVRTSEDELGTLRIVFDGEELETGASSRRMSCSSSRRRTSRFLSAQSRSTGSKNRSVSAEH